MSTVSRLVSDLLPSLHRLGDVLIGSADVLISAPGFEQRTLAIPASILPTSKGSAILLDYRPRRVDNRMQETIDLLRTKGISVTTNDIVEYDRFDPRDFAAELQTRLKVLAPKHVYVDISTMSKLAIMLVLHVCFTRRLEVTVLYGEAEAYGPSQEEFHDARRRNAVHRPTLQVFTGIYGMVRIDCLASVAMQGQQTAAVAFMSFNDALTQVLLNTVYPARLFLINSRPPSLSWREEATAWIHENVRREWESDNPVLENGLPSRSASTLDYRETISILLDLYWKLSPTHRVLLAPAGSKMQAVGCCIVKMLHPDIHIEYPSPEGFAPEYSRGVGSMWSLELGDSAAMLENFSAAEKSLFVKLKVPKEVDN